MICEGDPPRWCAIVRWLEEHKREICEADKGHVKIDYAGKTSVAFEIFRKVEAATDNR